jgi:hypothetical protein
MCDTATVSLLHLWGPNEQANFKYLQAATVESMTLAFPGLREEDLCHYGCL